MGQFQYVLCIQEYMLDFLEVGFLALKQIRYKINKFYLINY